MNLRRLTARTAVAGVTAALAAGALVGITSTAANAVDNTTAYTCAMGDTPMGTFSLHVSTPVVPPTVTAGQSFPANLLNLDADVTVPTSLVGPGDTGGVDGGKADDYAASLGASKIKAPITFGSKHDNGDGTTTFTGAGANLAFTTPKAGTYKVMLPSAFNFTPSQAGAPLPFSISCTTATPGDFGTVKVTKAKALMTGKAKKVAKGYNLTVTVKGFGSSIKPTGKVTAKVGTKKFVKKLSKGKAVIKLPKSAKGKKVKVSYGGDGYTAAGKTTVSIKK